MSFPQLSCTFGELEHLVHQLLFVICLVFIFVGTGAAVSSLVAVVFLAADPGHATAGCTDEQDGEFHKLNKGHAAHAKVEAKGTSCAAQVAPYLTAKVLFLILSSATLQQKFGFLSIVRTRKC